MKRTQWTHLRILDTSISFWICQLLRVVTASLERLLWLKISYAVLSSRKQTIFDESVRLYSLSFTILSVWLCRLFQMSLKRLTIWDFQICESWIKIDISLKWQSPKGNRSWVKSWMQAVQRWTNSVDQKKLDFQFVNRNSTFFVTSVRDYGQIMTTVAESRSYVCLRFKKFLGRFMMRKEWTEIESSMMNDPRIQKTRVVHVVSVSFTRLINEDSDSDSDRARLYTNYFAVAKANDSEIFKTLKVTLMTWFGDTILDKARHVAHDERRWSFFSLNYYDVMKIVIVDQDNVFT